MLTCAAVIQGVESFFMGSLTGPRARDLSFVAKYFVANSWKISWFCCGPGCAGAVLGETDAEVF